MSNTVTSFDPALKQLYKDDNVRHSTYKNRPMLALLPKDEGFGGRDMPIVNAFGNPQGRSSVFATAQANTTALKLEDFKIDIVSDYSVATISGELVDRASNNKHAFLTAVKSIIDAAMDSLSDAIETFIPRSGTGKVGTIATTTAVSTDTISLTVLDDVRNFEVGMSLVASQTDGGALRNAGAKTTLAKINRSSGTLTTSEAAWDTTITAIAHGDSLYVEGDAAAGSTNRKYSGFQAWLPASAPGGSDSFFGVNRSVDSRLYGTYYGGANETIEDRLLVGQSMASAEGGVPDIGFISPTKMRQLVIELGAKKEYVEMNALGPKEIVANVGFRGVVIQGDQSAIRMVSANKCPRDDVFLLEQSEWKLVSIGPAVRLIDDDSNKMLRQASADGFEVRIKTRSQVACKNPIGSARVSVAS
jgi:hypothetical protein